MFTTLLLAGFVVTDDTKAPPAGAADRNPAANASLDGNWTVICLEKNGQPVAEAKNATVMVKGNTATFKKQDGSAGTEMKALRFDFGREGKLYVTEANADGKFERVGADAPRPDGTAPPAAGGTDNRAGARADGSKEGIYVLTQDYLAVCIHDQGARTGPAGTGGQPGGAGAAAGDNARAGGQQPQNKSYCTVILKRANGAGQPDRDRPNPNPDK